MNEENVNTELENNAVEPVETGTPTEDSAPLENPSHEEAVNADNANADAPVQTGGVATAPSEDIAKDEAIVDEASQQNAGEEEVAAEEEAPAKEEVYYGGEQVI